MFFISLLILNMIFVRPAFNQDAGYLIGFFASSFLLFSFSSEKFIKQSVINLCVLFLLLSVWGLVQYLTGYGYLVNAGHRANALFFTPNTFSASINIIILPLITLYAFGRGYRHLLTVVLVLFAALLVTQSRGGWVAFISSMVVFSILIKILKINLDRMKIKRLIIGLGLVFIVYSIINLSEYNRMKNDLSVNDNIEHLIRSGSIVSTMSHRFKLYDIAWQQIKQAPFHGSGFHTYQYYQVRDQQPPFIGSVTRFAHNDYLQLWMETGIFGVALFVSIPLILISLLILIWKKISIPDKVVLLALLIGLVSFYVHALVDFLFYTPFLLMMYGCYLGYLNQLFNKYSQDSFFYTLELTHVMIRPVVIKCLIGLVGVSYLSQPAIAQLAFDQANRDKKRLDIKSALTYYEVARRFAPYESPYYLHEADIWYHAAKATGEAEPAQRADKLYEQGVTANPYEVTNLFWRAMLHRAMPELLPHAVSQETVLSWFQYVLQWLPNDQQAQAEYVRTLLLMGEYEQARQLLGDYLVKNPGSYYLIKVRTELGDSF